MAKFDVELDKMPVSVEFNYNEWVSITRFLEELTDTMPEHSLSKLYLNCWIKSIQNRLHNAGLVKDI
jgi:hypothetical protein